MNQFNTDESLTANVHVWIAKFDHSDNLCNDYEKILTLPEKQRALRFRTPELQLRFKMSRAILRKILTLYLDYPVPQEIEFSINKYGKPYLSHNPKNIKFNLSHSGDLIIYGISKDFEIGVDIEHIRQESIKEPLETYVLSHSEKTIFDTLESNQKTTAFYRIWTSKEAFVKALGVGLSKNLTEFEVSFAEFEKPKILSIDGAITQTNEWSLQRIHPAPHYVGAVVVHNPSFNLHFFDYDSENTRHIPNL